MLSPAGDLLIIVPSRARPGNAERLLSAVHETAKLATHVHLCVDEDDPRLGDYADLECGPGDRLEIGPRKGLARGRMRSRCAGRASTCTWRRSVMTTSRRPRTGITSSPGLSRTWGGTGCSVPRGVSGEDTPKPSPGSSNIVPRRWAGSLHAHLGALLCR